MKIKKAKAKERRRRRKKINTKQIDRKNKINLFRSPIRNTKPFAYLCTEKRAQPRISHTDLETAATTKNLYF